MDNGGSVVRRAKKPGRSPVKSTVDLQQRLRRAERRLKELQERHDLVMGAINEGVYDWNVIEDSIYYSDSVQKAVGLTPKLRRTTADWRNRIHPEDLPRYVAGFIDHFKGKTQRYECDYRYRALDGSWRWGDMTSPCAPSTKVSMSGTSPATARISPSASTRCWI